MKITPYNQSKSYTNAVSLSESREYQMGDKDIDCALVQIKGKYPGGNKFATNTKSKELLFVIEGEGAIEIKNREARKFGKHDVILIEAGEVYRFDARASFCVVCTPPWSPEQHLNID